MCSLPKGGHLATFTETDIDTIVKGLSNLKPFRIKFFFQKEFYSKMKQRIFKMNLVLRLLIQIRGLSKKFVEFVNKNKTTIPITFKFVYNEDTFTTDIITKF